MIDTFFRGGTKRLGGKMVGIHLGKILVVDDEEIITGVTEVVLSEAGYQVEVANSGMGALKILETSVPEGAILMRSGLVRISAAHSSTFA